MKEKILEVLDVARGGALSLDDIFRKCGYNDANREDFLAFVKELSDEKKIYCVNSKNGLYTLNPFKEGIFHIRRNGDCYVSCEGRNITIKSQNKFDCMDKDKVLVRITDFNSYEGTIKDIIERNGIVGELTTINGKRFVKVKDVMYETICDSSIVDGMLVGIKVDDVKTNNYYRCTIDRVIGHKNAPRIDEQILLYEYGFPVMFSESAMECTKNLETRMSDEEKSKRTDLRDKMIFTIDGDDTKDIDDAISIDSLPDGNYLLGVHIADVSHFVDEGSTLDLEARERATSVYMPGVVSPMYPPVLSNGLCSLNPDTDRFAISCEMTIKPNGEILDYNIFKSVIHSRKQMTYKKVNSILEDNVVPEGYIEFSDTLKLMKQVSDKLRGNRQKKGMLNFDSSEIKISVDEAGNVLSIDKRSTGMGEELIEDFMLAANESVATYLMDLGVHSVYRCHDFPDMERLKRVLTIITAYGDKVKSKINDKDPKVIQSLIEELKDKENFDIYSNMILRCMAKADYETNNIGHFGLGINATRGEAYTHFTSPIRRYPDTTIHRILSQVLSGDLDRLYSDEFLRLLKEIAKHSSEREVMADHCEREADDMKMALYMSDHINEEFEGRITGFTKNVCLQNFQTLLKEE